MMLKAFRERRWLRMTTAFIIGIFFGFFLQKGGATEYGILVDQLLLRDFTVLKIIFSAIVVGSLGIYTLVGLRAIDLSVKPLAPGPILTGGLIFGAGFALLGYCPGTLAGAVGTGSVHALLGAAGMMLGTSAFASIYDSIKSFIGKSDRGSITIPELLEVKSWYVIIVISALLGVIMAVLEVVGL